MNIMLLLGNQKEYIILKSDITNLTPILKYFGDKST